MIYESDRLILRVFDESDVEAAKLFWGNDEVMQHCLGATDHDKLPKVLLWYKNCHEEQGLSVYAVVEKETGRVIGAAGFNVSESLEKVELIYHFAKSSWGKGYATEAARAGMEVAKANGQVRLVYASADPINADSLKILEKVGFQNKGMKWFDDTNQEEPYYEYPIMSTI